MSENVGILIITIVGAAAMAGITYWAVKIMINTVKASNEHKN